MDNIHTYREQEVWLACSEALFEWDDAFHALLLGDRPRMQAYQAAIREAVQPGMTVVDLGTGTGILAQWALEAGAARVYGIEMNPEVLEKARQRLARAGFTDRFVPMQGISFEIELPDRVDLIVSEIMGNLADNESMVPILRDARERFLHEDGSIIPQEVVSYIVPVEARDAHAQISQGSCRVLNARYSLEKLLRDRSLSSPFDMYYDTITGVESYLSKPQMVRRYGGAWDQDEGYEQRLVFSIHRDGWLTGFKGYFVAQLSKSAVLDISSADIAGRMSSDSWKHAFLPIASPMEVQAGEQLELDFQRAVPSAERHALRQRYQWRGRVLRGDEVIGQFRHST